MRYDGRMAPLLEVNDLQIRFGASHTVRGIGFEIKDGEVLTLSWAEAPQIWLHRPNGGICRHFHRMSKTACFAAICVGDHRGA